MDVLKMPEYKFLQKMIDENKVLYLTLSGSISYGTNNENSDIDVRGVIKTPKNVLLGMDRKFEQFDDEQTDTVMYSFNKYAKMLLDCNPNSVEFMGTRPEHRLYIHPFGQELLDNYGIFLSQKVFYTFKGYAMTQLRNLENALVRNSDSESRKDARIAERLMNMLYDFNTRYNVISEGSIKIYHENNELLIDSNIKGYPLRHYVGIMSEMSNTISDFDSVYEKNKQSELNIRNRKKTTQALDKQAMHLIRLFIEAIELGSTGKIVTYREKEQPLLMDIRNGKFRKSDSEYHSSFFEMLDELDKEMRYVENHTVLPVKADFKRVEEFVMSVNSRCL